MNILLGLIIKHFVCDFPLQAMPWMYKNKGTYGHPGGIVHALIHAYGTYTVLSISGIVLDTVLIVAVIDGIVHYHIDWAKMRLGAHWDLKPDNSEWFWILLGVDQLLHYLTYWTIAWWLT